MYLKERAILKNVIESISKDFSFFLMQHKIEKFILLYLFKFLEYEKVLKDQALISTTQFSLMCPYQINERFLAVFSVSFVHISHFASSSQL